MCRQASLKWQSLPYEQHETWRQWMWFEPCGRGMLAVMECLCFYKRFKIRWKKCTKSNSVVVLMEGRRPLSASQIRKSLTKMMSTILSMYFSLSIPPKNDTTISVPPLKQNVEKRQKKIAYLSAGLWCSGGAWRIANSLQETKGISQRNHYQCPVTSPYFT